MHPEYDQKMDPLECNFFLKIMKNVTVGFVNHKICYRIKILKLVS